MAVFGKAMTIRLGCWARPAMTFVCRSKSITSRVFSGFVMTRKFWMVAGMSDARVAFTRDGVFWVEGRAGSRAAAVADSVGYTSEAMPVSGTARHKKRKKMADKGCGIICGCMGVGCVRDDRCFSDV